MMGLPIDKLVVATNENDVLNEFFRTGIYRVRKSAETYHTSSPSMDISKASNFERFIFDLLGRNADRVRTLFAKVEQSGGFDLSGAPGSDGDEFSQVSRFGFVSGKSLHADRLRTIRDLFEHQGLMVDTHTADGIKVARENMTAGIPMIVLETALPAKFNETIREALGRDAERPAGFEQIESLTQRFDVMGVDVAAIKDYIARRTGL
jgi:threonine synthase